MTHSFALDGYGAEIITRVVASAFDYLDAPPVRVCAKDVPVPYAASLEAAALPQVEDVVNAARSLVHNQL
ncbi:MAG TPA: transketolase C-terminal domain-containing protein [Chloroflexota bacterium]|nr:transketolase C-terminal domain-containing protein [Chloroflexota bacterium]